MIYCKREIYCILQCHTLDISLNKNNNKVIWSICYIRCIWRIESSPDIIYSNLFVSFIPSINILAVVSELCSLLPWESQLVEDWDLLHMIIPWLWGAFITLFYSIQPFFLRVMQFCQRDHYLISLFNHHSIQFCLFEPDESFFIMGPY